MLVAVARGNDRYEFFRSVPAASPAGMGIALAAGAAAGSAGGPVGTLIGIGVSLIPTVGNLIGKIFGGGGPSKEERAAADQFEAKAGATTRLFNEVQAQPVITAADVTRVEVALSELANMAAQARAGSYVARKWADDPAYRPAYEARLQQIRQAAPQAAGGAVQPGAGGGAAAVVQPGGFSSGINLQTVLLVVAAVAVAKLI